MSFNHSTDNQSSTEMADINMTPLIDVMLVLLIIFIITVPVMTQTVPVDLPQTSQQASTEKPTTITLSINKDGNVFWNNQPITEPQLEQQLQTSSQQQPQPEVHIRGDKEVQYQYMIKIMAAAQHAGLTRLGFVTTLESP